MRPVATDDEIDLDLIAPAPRTVKVTFVVRGEPTSTQPDGPVIGHDRVTARVAGSLSVPQMARLLRLEARIHTSMQAAEDDQDAVAVFEGSIGQAAEEVADILAENTPGLFDWIDWPTTNGPVRGKRTLELNPEQLLTMLAWLSGGGSVADAIASALTAGASVAVDAPAETTPEDGLPFGSSSTGRSPSISSGSDESTDGSLATGLCREDLETVSPGASSARTSSTPVAA
jgi:hypothetical protein